MRRVLSTLRRLASQRRIGVVALALLVHAVAITTLHHHAVAPEASAAAAVTAPSDHGAQSNEGPGGCPACQLQHGSVVDLPRVSEPFLAETAAALGGAERLQAVLRAGDTSPPGRAPPVL
jgi:hypothetical protein